MSGSPKTKPNTREYDENYERIFGKKEVERGKFVWSVEQQRWVPVDEFVYIPIANDAPLHTDRNYHGLRHTDGTPIDTRTKHNEFMRSRGLTVADDYKHTWKQEQERREKLFKGQDPAVRAKIRDDVGRAAYQVLEKGYKPSNLIKNIIPKDGED